LSSRFASKIVLITGAGGFIGRAAAIKFYNEGAALILNDISADKLAETVANMPDSSRVVKAVADVANHDEVARMMETGLERMGKIDVLVNVAGGGHDGLWITEIEEKNWDYVIDLNLKSAFNCIKAITPHFLQRKTGKIINVSSLAKDGVPWFAQAKIGRSSYSAANAGLIGLTRTLAFELGPDGITVNCVVPGPVQTPNSDQGILGRLEKDPRVSCTPQKMIPLGRLATPEEVAGGICFLASDDANYISGHSLYITGGL